MTNEPNSGNVAPAEFDALMAQEEREEDARNLAAAEGRYIVARSESELAVALLELEWRVVESDDVGEVVGLHDQAEALRRYLRTSRRSLGLQKQSEVLKLRAERRAGELLLGLERAQGIRVDLSAPGLAEDEPVPIGSPYGRALLEAGLHERRAQRFQEVARADQELYKAFVPSLEEMRAFAIELAEDGDGRVTEQLERRDFSTAAFLRSVRAGSAAAEVEGHRWDECVTPGSIVRRTRDLLGAIELDPCADSKLSVGAERSLTRADDGLEQSWAARGLLVHPPYSRIAEFVEKLVRERATGHAGEAVLVLPAPVEDHLWQASWWPLIESQPMCLLGERFRDERSPYPLTMVSYAGERRDEFVAAFRGLGPIFSAHGGERR